MEFAGRKLDLNTAEVAELALEKLATDPVTGLVTGRIYYNTADEVIRLYNGTEWVNAGGEIEAATAAKLGGFKTTPTEGYAISETTTQSLVLVDKPFDRLNSSKEALWDIDNKPNILALKSLSGRVMSNIAVEKTTDGSAWHVVVKDSSLEMVFHSPNDVSVLEQTEGAYSLGAAIACPVILYRKPDAIIEVGGTKYFWFGGVAAPQAFNPQYLKATSYTYDGTLGNYFTITDDMQSTPLYTEEFERFIPDGTMGVQISEDGRAYVSASAGIEPATETILGGIKLKHVEETPVTGWQYWFGVMQDYVYTTAKCDYHQISAGIDKAFWNEKPTVVACKGNEDTPSEYDIPYGFREYECDDGVRRWTVEDSRNLNDANYSADPAQKTFTIYNAPDGAVQLDSDHRAFVDLSAYGKHMEFSFRNSDTWEVNHNLGYYPIVHVLDSTGHLALADIQHVDNNKLIVTFSESQSGRVILG